MDSVTYLDLLPSRKDFLLEIIFVDRQNIFSLKKLQITQISNFIKLCK